MRNIDRFRRPIPQWHRCGSSEITPAWRRNGKLRLLVTSAISAVSRILTLLLMTIALSSCMVYGRPTPLISVQDPGAAIPEGYYVSWSWDSKKSEWTRQEEAGPEFYVLKKEHYYRLTDITDTEISVFWIQNLLDTYYVIQQHSENHEPSAEDSYSIYIAELRDGAIIVYGGLSTICEKHSRDFIKVEQSPPFLFLDRTHFRFTGDNAVDWQILRGAVRNYHHELHPERAFRPAS